MRLGLKIAILQSGHSQRAISAASGIPESRLSTIVNGWGEVRPEERQALQRCLGVSTDAFEQSPATEARSLR
jgi:Helix-turn-helix